MQEIEQRTLVLSAENVQDVVGSKGLDHFMDELVTRVESAFHSYSQEETKIPARSGFSYERPNSGLIEWMPLYEDDDSVMLKLVGYHPSNPADFGLPTILSTISTYDTRTGHLESIVDGVLLTALRTGAASAVASKYLAHPDSKVIGLIGCGVQAVTQLHALGRIFDFEKVLIFDTDEETLKSFEKRIESFKGRCEILISDIETIVSESDILSTATSIDVGAGPLFEDIETKEHLHINAVGSDFPGKIELPREFLLQSLVCPDFLAQAVQEGECQQLKSEEIGAAVDEIVRNAAEYEVSKFSRTVFDSTGWALEDRVAVNLALEISIQLGIGEYISIESIPKDSKSPFEFLAFEEKTTKRELFSVVATD